MAHAVTWRFQIYSEDRNLRLRFTRMQMRVGVHFEYRSRSEESRFEWSAGSVASHISSTKSHQFFGDFELQCQSK